MEKFIGKYDAGPSQKVKADEFSALKNELKVFEATGKRTGNLENLYRALKSVPPTSVEAERAFSAAGLLVTKKPPF